jgi:DsbC/DsbD-like thiol-disulfide interchange protein
MYIRRMMWLLSILLLEILAQGSLASDEPLKVVLVSEVTSIQPGKPFYVGLHLHHGMGYHTYWKFPGIVGVPTGMIWSLPPGFVAGEIEWPEPESVLMFKIKAQGFERDVLLPIKITPPTDLKIGQAIRLSGKSSWMSCEKTCHPGFTDVSLELPVIDAEPATDSKWQPVFAQERSRFPDKVSSWKFSAKEHGQTVVLTVLPLDEIARKFSAEAKSEPVYFFTEDGWIDTDKPQVTRLNADGSLTLELTRSDVYLGKVQPTALHGILYNPEGWLLNSQVKSFRISPELKR